MEDIITSTANPSVKRIKALAQKKYREEEKVFVVEGLRHIRQAFDAGFVIDTLAWSERAMREDGAEALIQSARSARARLLPVTDELLSRMTGRDNAQSMLAVVKQRILGMEAISGDGLWVALDGIRDPGNLGTIMRTADAVGAKGVLLLGDTCDPWSPESIRATMGSFADMPVIRCDYAGFAAWKKKTSCRVIGTHLRTNTDYRQGDYTIPMMLVMGSEQSGMSDDIASLCDQLVRIPMAGETESLNLAVSTGIMLYEMMRAKL